jgi:hypothetical protein
VILWGNHDRAVVSSWHHFSGYTRPGPETLHLVKAAQFDRKLKIAYSAHGYLMTHAGLHSQFRYNNVPDALKQDPAAFADWANAQDRLYIEGHEEATSPNYKATVDAISRTRGGPSNYGGILWRDISEALFDGYPQVFGHSADREHQVRYVGPRFHTRSLKDYQTWALANKVEAPMSYCVDVGGKGDRPGDNCLAGVWLPEGRVVRVDL